MNTLQRAAAASLRSTVRPAVSRRVPTLARFESSAQSSRSTPAALENPEAAFAGSAVARQENAAEATPSHKLDYAVVQDYRTSNFSPIPHRVMDGSEPGEITPAAVLSGAPVDLQARTVRIYKPTKPATQSGNWHGHHWRMDWDVLSKGHRWENPLMGWQSSADAMQGTHLNFETKEDAIRFAHKQGYEYFVQEPNERKIVPKAYATQFEHSAKKLKQVRTK